MNIIYYIKKDSGLGNYARSFINTLSILYPRDEFKMYQENTNLDSIDVFHSFGVSIPKKIARSSIFKIITIDIYSYHSAPWWKKKYLLYKYKKLVQKIDLITTFSEQGKKDIVKLLSINKDKIRVIYPINQLEFKKEYSENEEFEIQYKFNLPKRFILNVGKVEKKNNQLSIVKAIKGTEIPLVIVGEKTSYLKKIQRFILKNKMDNQVVFIEKADNADLAHLYQLAEIFVYPSLSIGNGTPIIHALNAEIVSITSNIKGVLEFGGDNSMYVNANSVEDIKAKINFLWKNKSEGARRVEKSINHTAKFQNEYIAKQIMDLYNNKV